MPAYRVLIVDDQRDIRNLLSTALSALPVQLDVVEVPSAEEAMLVTRGTIDLMVADVHLPGISGLDLFHRIRMRHPKLKIMLMTGLSDPEIREEVEEAGAEAFFYKPVDLMEFLQKVRDLLGIASESEKKVVSEAAPRPGQAAQALAARLEGLCRKAGVGLAAVIATDGQVVAQAGILQGIYSQAGLQVGFAQLHKVNARLADRLFTPKLAYATYLAGRDYHFYLAPISPTHLLVLTAEQSFQQRLGQFQEWLPAAVRELGRLLSGNNPVAFTPPENNRSPQLGPASQPEEKKGSSPLNQVNVDPADDEITAEELAAVDRLFEPGGGKKIKTAELDEFWNSLSEEETSHSGGEGAISYSDAQDMGLTPE